MRIVHPFDVVTAAFVRGEQHHQVGRLEFDREAGDLQHVRKLLGVEQGLFDVELLHRIREDQRSVSHADWPKTPICIYLVIGFRLFDGHLAHGGGDLVYQLRVQTVAVVIEHGIPVVRLRIDHDRRFRGRRRQRSAERCRDGGAFFDRIGDLEHIGGERLLDDAPVAAIDFLCSALGGCMG